MRFPILALYCVIGVVLHSSMLSQLVQPGLRMNGRYLTTPCLDTVILRGVNKMIVWTGDLDVRKASYAEIKKTGANCVRIVWLAQPGQFEVDAGPEGLDRTIQDCIDADMIPMVELHDATGDWSKLQMTVDYWLRPDVVSVIKKHEKYLIVNIANECGNETVTNEQFTAGYTSALARLRNADIHTPIVIDASDWGKNLEQLVACGPALMLADPDRNVMFSVHTYWAASDGADQAFIANQFQMALNVGLPFIVGEFTHTFNRGSPCTYVTDYASIIQECQSKGIGWLAWEWGPGNEYNEPTCEIMNMTTNSYYETLKDTWAKVVAITSPNSIQATSVTPQYIVTAGACDPSDVRDELLASNRGIGVYPNPVFNTAKATLAVELDRPVDARIDVYDATGQLLMNVFNGLLTAGRHNIEFAPTNHGVNWIVFSIAHSNSFSSVISLPVMVIP